MKTPTNNSESVSRKRRSYFLNLLAVVLLAGCTAGCIVIPTPEFDSGAARANINKKTPRQFEVGKTTRAEVVLTLGEPDAVSPDERKLAYRSEKICGFWAVGGYGSAAGGPIEKDRYLVAEFNAQGVLQKMERSSRWVGSTDPDKKLGIAAMTNLDATIRIQSFANWLADVDGYKPHHATEMMGLPGKLLLTDTELKFVSKGQFANDPPAFTMSYAAMSELTVDKFMFGRRLVIRSRNGEIHAFEILGPRGITQDRQKLQEVHEFLQSKINQPMP